MAEVVFSLSDELWLDLRRSRRRSPRPFRGGPDEFWSLPRDITSPLGVRTGRVPGAPVRVFPNLGFVVAELPSAEVARATAALLEAEGVKAVSHPESFEIIAPVGGYQKTVDTLSRFAFSWHHALVGIDRLHQNGSSGRGVLVGVLDSGVDIEHTPQLAGRVASYATFDASGAQIDEPMADPFRHGTHVCGIIAGNKIGAAPAVSLAVGRVAPNGRTTFPQMVAGLEWLCANFPRVRVINMSVGKIANPTPNLVTMVERLNALGKLLVTAIGNDGQGTSRTPGNLPGALGVGAVDMNRSVPSFSGGMKLTNAAHVYYKPDLVMPGVDIPSCVPGGSVMTASGTSMAAPMLTGLAALMLEMSPEMDAATLHRVLLDLCVDLPEAPDRDGKGLPDAERLVE